MKGWFRSIAEHVSHTKPHTISLWHREQTGVREYKMQGADEGRKGHDAANLVWTVILGRIKHEADAASQVAWCVYRELRERKTL